MTQQDLADILSVSNQAVSKWESGRNLPDIAIQRVICDTFNITMEELHAGERDIKKRNKTKKIRKENKIFSIALMCIVPVMVFFVVYFIINFRALKIYYSNSQITNEENSIRANLLIFELPRKLIIFIELSVVFAPVKHSQFLLAVIGKLIQVLHLAEICQFNCLVPF